MAAACPPWRAPLRSHEPTPSQKHGHAKARGHAARRSRSRRRGTVLIVTMWILLVVAGLVLVLARAMRAAGDRSANELAATQADAVEQGAIQYVLSTVDGLKGQTPSDADTPCEAIQVGDGAFWILRATGDDERTYGYGITDEAAKVNLNTASLEMISKLPGMTAEFAASIVDWRDPDSNVTAGGAENEYYLMLPDPYECKNSPLETVEELFLIRGASKDIIVGQDANRNGVLDPGESATPLGGTFSSTGSHLYRGIINYATVYSIEPATAGGGQRINVNDPQSRSLTELLRNAVSPDRLPGVLDRVRRERPFRNVIDFYFRAGLTMAEFRQVVNQITTGPARIRPGLVNVNTAPKEVLLCLPGLEDSDASALLAQRPTADADRTSIAWVAEALPRAKAIAIGGHITAQSFQFSADIVSLAAGGRAFKRCRAMIDASSSPPKVIYRQSLTHLGWPLSPDIITQLRSGTPLERLTRTVGQKVGG
jgi:type II secretory pathway component PulK